MTAPPCCPKQSTPVQTTQTMPVNRGQFPTRTIESNQEPFRQSRTPSRSGRLRRIPKSEALHAVGHVSHQRRQAELAKKSTHHEEESLQRSPGLLEVQQLRFARPGRSSSFFLPAAVTYTATNRDSARRDRPQGWRVYAARRGVRAGHASRAASSSAQPAGAFRVREHARPTP